MQGESPVKDATPVNQTKLLTFYDAMERVLDGRMVSKLEWNDTQFYGVLEKDILMLHKPDGKLYNWIIIRGDIAGNDWFVLPE